MSGEHMHKHFIQSVTRSCGVVQYCTNCGVARSVSNTETKSMPPLPLSCFGDKKLCHTIGAESVSTATCVLMCRFCGGGHMVSTLADGIVLFPSFPCGAPDADDGEVTDADDPSLPDLTPPDAEAAVDGSDEPAAGAEDETD